MFSIGNNELAALPKADKYSPCKNCGKKHLIIYSKTRKLLDDGTYTRFKINKNFGFVKCGKKTLLASINGKLLN